MTLLVASRLVPPLHSKLARFMGFLFLIPLLWILNTAWGAPPTQPLPTLNSLGELRALSRREANLHYPVKITGVVTAINWESTVFLQDSTGGSFFNLEPGMPSLHPGDLLEVEGLSSSFAFVPGIQSAKIQFLGL